MSRENFKQLPVSIVTENYRGINRLSYSALKLYSSNRKLYRDLYVVKDEEIIKAEKEKKDKSPYIRMGNLVDVRLTDGDNFDDYFIVTEAPVPTAQMLTLTDFLINITLDDTNVDGEVVTSFSSRFEKAYEMLKESNGGKLGSGMPKFLERFPKEGEKYFEEKLKANGKAIVSAEEYQISEGIVIRLRTSDATKAIFSHPHQLTKFAVLGTLNEEPYKIEVDLMNFDHEKKTIQPYDLKIVSNLEGFIWESYLDSKYYVQGGSYKWILDQWIKTVPGYEDYKVLPMKFIVADQKNYLSPLVFDTTEQHYIQSFTGFLVGKKRYDGIYKIMEDLKYSVENDVWDISPSNHRNGGIVRIPEFEDLIEI